MKKILIQLLSSSVAIPTCGCVATGASEGKEKLKLRMFHSSVDLTNDGSGFRGGAAIRTLPFWAKVKQITGSSNSPYFKAMKYIKDGSLITAVEVNDVLSFLDVGISKEELESSLNSPRLEFENLNLNTIKTDFFKSQIGAVRNERNAAGVYIWTHKSTGDMYVGSSNTLARRLIGYFKGTHPDVGIFIPKLRKEGLNAFTLQVIPLKELRVALALEQYFLLNKKYNLNTLRVVNQISGSNSKTVYMYTKDYSRLIFSSSKQEDFIFKLKIHHSIINSNKVYLGKYIFTEKPVSGAEESNLSFEEVLSLLDRERFLEKGKKVLIVSERDEKDEKSFNSIKDCIAFLNTIAPSNKTSLYRHIIKGRPYQGYYCRFENETFRKSIGVKVTHVSTGLVSTYPTLRKAALSFGKEINTTGPTLKAYIQSGKLFKDKYYIEYLND